MTYLGRPTRQIDWLQRTSGGSRYTADLSFPGLLVGRILRSPHPYAAILSINTSKAADLPGVHAVVTIQDFPAGARYLHEGARDRPPLADGVVRYVGEEIAAVAAETAEQAEAALQAIVISYQPQRGPLTVDDATCLNSVMLHKRTHGKPNVSKIFRRRWGDPDKARNAGPISVTGRFLFGRQTHASMEPNSVVAQWNNDEKRLHLWLSTQAPILIRDEVANVLGLAKDHVVCHEVAVGGGFGSKSRVSEHEAIAGALAIKAKRPVSLVLTRSEEFEATKSRHPFHMNVTLRADPAGQLRAIEGDVKVENGAYDHVGGSVTGASLRGPGLIYRPDGIRLDAELIDTATLPGGAFRGYGITQITFALESLMDELAERLGRDPVDLRIQNANYDGEATLIGAHPHSVRLRECLQAAREAIGWDRLRSERPQGQGVGIASGVHLSGSYAETDANRSDAAIDVYTTGKVTVRFGGADSGTGQRTLLAQIAADELEVAIEDVDVFMMDTEKTPFDLGAWSSRGTHYSGHAVRMVAQATAAKLKAIATAVGGNPSIGQLVALSNKAVNGVLTVETSYVEKSVVRPDPKTGYGNVSPTYNYAAHATHIDVDTRTGEIRLLDYVAVHDTGTPLNPTALYGQIVGAAVMGIGAALREELIFARGKLANTGYLYYALPRANDVPPVRAILVDCHDALGPYGAKGVGELGINPPSPAIGNAIYNAIGIRLRELPFTPDKVLAALAEKAGRRRHFSLWRRPNRWWIALVRWAYPLGLFALLHRRRTFRPSCRTPPSLAALETPTTVSDALGRIGPDALPLGGGTDLLPRRTQGLAHASRLVSVADIPELKTFDASQGTLVIGAAVTLTQLTDAARGHAVLAQAALTIATPQIRNAATLAGNLAQANRCWFFRNGFECFKRIGPTAPCYAIEGDHRFYHAAIDGHRCQAVTPSDLATALIALDAELILRTRSGERAVPVASFYTGPGETILRDDELVIAATIGATARRHGVFEKLRLWEGDFAVVSVAITADIGADGRYNDLRIVCGGIAPTPWRAVDTERVLNGTKVTAEALRTVLDRELNAKAHPLRRNGWKLDALAGLCERAIERLNA
jgi:CO/xanthine dehydrogenase Mo-binding subunit/CO/xanthine dehydrogenase FAD-binding subunit